MNFISKVLGASNANRTVIKTVLVNIAMEAEAAPLVEHLGLTKCECNGDESNGDGGQSANILSGPMPAVVYEGEVNECKIFVVTNGKDPKYGVDNVGTVCAGLVTYLSLLAISPDIVINAGTCGGFISKGAQVGDVFISSAFKNHDRRIAIPGFSEWGIGDYAAVPTPNLVKELGYKTGVVTTGNSLDHVPKDDEIMAANDASVKDMEGAAIAAVAEMYNTPCFGVKVVTDLVDGDKPTEDEFLQNLSAAANSLKEAMPKVIDFVLNKPIADL
uniref:Nucleoside phosphorylase domain-containing protein n=1 Tax=Fibrocapsa japonica TaxID=94617 RepID=A0A7S2V4K5_9STRA